MRHSANEMTVARAAREALRNSYQGVSWRHPVVAHLLWLVDIVDSLIRQAFSDRRGLPRYSARVRATGIRGEVGGRKFLMGGRRNVRLARELAGLLPDDEVLEIGCGAGRNAYAFVDLLTGGAYLGLDVDSVQIAACRKSRQLRQGGCRFVLAGVENEIYNPGAAASAAAYRFPLADESVDFVFAWSVFTHMFADECENYVREILRVLRPGGRCAITVFALLYGRAHGRFDFTELRGDGVTHLAYPATPRKAVAYSGDTVRGWFGDIDIEIHRGTWAGRGGGVDDLQDWVIATKPSAVEPRPSWFRK